MLFAENRAAGSTLPLGLPSNFEQKRVPSEIPAAARAAVSNNARLAENLYEPLIPGAPLC